MPFFITPPWCVQKRLVSQQCLPEVYPNSMLWKMPPLFAGLLNILCYVVLSCFIVGRLFVKKRTTSSVARTAFLMAVMLIGVTDFVVHSFKG